MKITPKEASQIMGNHSMECSSCPVSNDIGHCQTMDACADVALKAGQVMMEEAEQDAFDMATLLRDLSDVYKVHAISERAEKVRKKYEDHR